MSKSLITPWSCTCRRLRAQADWSGKGEAGIVFARGNSDTDTANVKFGLARELDRWKHSFDVFVLRASNNGITNAESYGAAWQSDFKMSERSFWFGNLATNRTSSAALTLRPAQRRAMATSSSTPRPPNWSASSARDIAGSSTH